MQSLGGTFLSALGIAWVFVIWYVIFVVWLYPGWSLNCRTKIDEHHPKHWSASTWPTPPIHSPIGPEVAQVMTKGRYQQGVLLNLTSPFALTLSSGDLRLVSYHSFTLTQLEAIQSKSGNMRRVQETVRLIWLSKYLNKKKHVYSFHVCIACVVDVDRTTPFGPAQTL